ncbi:MAG: asparagine--tRNA ligase [Deltaproteobacteria bacterium]|nr:asparagine--tRNA ligase [Deltaproteobacteria bacterium]MBW1747379.1 asparagine--tRNA ligase [Deltaproteobacteria bacterium]MBW1827347.1 asparagine--tRNA ligase [Deltaproteobacteria bacterium]MBW1968766.1 asparagine--tRNA ligase [Deltaproteobacteria bacterium]MBW2156522.1 asparagine--tRNA ligase [Deltaproteobacteria bacterium]
MKRTKIIKLIKSERPIDEVLIKGWVRTKRDSKDFSFIEVNDGSCLKNMQIIVDNTTDNYKDIIRISTGSAVAIRGKLEASKGPGQKWEVVAERVEILNIAPENYPLQKKRHTDEFLRNIAHLRPRTNKYGAAFRIRSELSYAIHNFFRNKGFRYIHSPIITGSDCEGAGELFRVTTIDPDDPPRKEGKIDYSRDFFGKEANLTVSGQLSAEMFALALGDVYTFGPTFRAENSHTRRHVAEFWMVEPEMAFCDLEGNMDLAEEMIKHLTSFILEECKEDIELFAKFVDKTLIKTLNNVATSDFKRLTYASALDILKKSGKKFKYDIDFGKDLQTEHERYLTEDHFKKPLIVFNYPKEIKPFYMRLNDDNQTVAAMDVLVPGIGEIIGGSQREERLEVLENRMDEMGMPKENYWWYLDSRRFGSVEHSGFGLGFERLIMLMTGIRNIRDVIPFPRTPTAIEF